MNFKLFKISLICAAMGLASCGGGGGSSASSTTSTTNQTQVTPNTGTVTVTTLPGNVVSIGASGTNFKTADATGKAVFTGLTPGAVDVHVFSADGHSATSYMGVNTATIVDTTSGMSGGSVIDVYVQVANADVYGQTLYLHTADNDYYTGFWDFLSGKGTIYLYSKPVGSVVSGTLYMAQGQATSSANTVYGKGEAVNLGNVSFTAQDPATSTVQQNFTATFSATPVTAPLLATVQSITPPTGLSATNLYVGSARVIAKAPATNLVFPDAIHAADTGVHTWSVYSANATVAATNEWVYQAPFTVGASLSATATLTAFPTVAANQAGSTISWTNPTGSWSLNGVQIHDAKYNVIWSIITDPSVSSITLPTVPTAANLLITAGTAYQIDVANSKFSGSYVEAISNPNAVTGFESIRTTNVAYTR